MLNVELLFKAEWGREQVACERFHRFDRDHPPLIFEETPGTGSLQL